jgi:hypothetical protein
MIYSQLIVELLRERLIDRIPQTTSTLQQWFYRLWIGFSIKKRASAKWKKRVWGLLRVGGVRGHSCVTQESVDTYARTRGIRLNLPERVCPQLALDVLVERGIKFG